MAESMFEKFTFLNLREITKDAEIPYMKVYNNLKGNYGSLSDQERRLLFNAIQEKFEIAAAALGFSIEGRPIKPKG